ncbi:hypothetical protein [Bacteroides caccae]|uniref:hypothetical protein n=1 Tax=Bacteroides caccae TaxID=47678 RepID=UPI003568F5C3
MRNRYNILFSLFWASLVLVGIETQAQENLKFAPNDIPVPWYSQKGNYIQSYSLTLVKI